MLFPMKQAIVGANGHEDSFISDELKLEILRLHHHLSSPLGSKKTYLMSVFALGYPNSLH